jgi:hypothetical protein
MPTEEWQTFCPRGHALVLGRREIPNHVLHFLVTFLTCGLWVFPWIIQSVIASRAPYRSSVCGTEGINS